MGMRPCAMGVWRLHTYLAPFDLPRQEADEDEVEQYTGAEGDEEEEDRLDEGFAERVAELLGDGENEDELLDSEAFRGAAKTMRKAMRDVYSEVRRTEAGATCYRVQRSTARSPRTSGWLRDKCTSLQKEELALIARERDATTRGDERDVMQRLEELSLQRELCVGILNNRSDDTVRLAAPPSDSEDCVNSNPFLAHGKSQPI